MPVAVQMQSIAGRLRGRAEAEDAIRAACPGIAVLCFAIRRFDLVLEHYGYALGDLLIAALWRRLRESHPEAAEAGFRWSAGSLILVADSAAIASVARLLPPQIFVRAPEPLAGHFGVVTYRLDCDGSLTSPAMVDSIDRFVALPGRR